MFEQQLKRDVELLQRLKIMDYSLLIGIHDMGRGNKENLRDGMLTVFSVSASGGLRSQASDISTSTAMSAGGWSGRQT